VIAVDFDGGSEVMLHVGSFRCCADWLPDGRLVVVSTRDGQLLRQEPDGSLVTHADLATASSPPAGNELVVDACGNAYVNGGGFNLAAGEPFAPGIIALATPDGSAHQVADRFALPERHAHHRRRRDADRRRVLRQTAHRLRRRGGRKPLEPARLGRPRRRRPRGICLDAEGAVWYGDVPNKRCVRVHEGGEVLQTIKLDRGCFACALGGPERRTLFMVATEWKGAEEIFAEPRTGQLLAVEARAPGVGWP
jgi:sugar lactone lactonase YvrE